MINSCKKDIKEVTIEDIGSLQGFYNQHRPVASSIFKQTKPRWEQVVKLDQDSVWVYEITLENPEKVGITSRTLSEKDLTNYPYNHALRLVLFVDPISKKVVKGCYMAIETDQEIVISDIHYKKPNKLNGHIVYYNLDGSWGNGCVYRDGKVVAKINISSPEQVMALKSEKPRSQGKVMLALPDECTTGWIETGAISCIEVGGSGSATCRWVSTGYASYTICGGGGGGQPGGGTDGSGGYNGGSSGGGGVRDCAGIMNGQAYESDCGCIGGKTGISSCADITEKIKNECLNSVWTSLKSNLDNKIINLLHTTFGQNHSINFKIVDGNVNSGAPAQTEVIKNTVNSSGELFFDIKVTLNKNTMPGYSQEFVATTMVHEIMHGYFNENKIYYNQQFKQHQLMAEGYVESMKSAVKDLFPNLPDKSAYALVLNGFNDMFENNLTGWNALLIKYQLTTQEIYDTQIAYKSNIPSAPGTKCPPKP